jgi:hypothetical protein
MLVLFLQPDKIPRLRSFFTLSEVPEAETADELPPAYFPVRAKSVLKAPSHLSVWVRTFVSRPKVFVAVGGKIISAGQGTGVHALTLAPPESPAAGNQTPGGRRSKTSNTTLTVYVFDERNRFIHSTQLPVTMSGF